MEQLTQSYLESMPLLQSVFVFDNNDLIANRYGQFSDIQKLQLQRLTRRDQLSNWLLMGILSLAGYAIIANLYLISSEETFYFNIVLLVLFFALIILDVLFIWFNLYYQSNGQMVRPDALAEKVSGIAVLSTNQPDKGLILLSPYLYLASLSNAKNSHKFRIDNQKFSISSEAFHALENGAAYCVYYTKMSESQLKTILSIEPLNKIDQSPVYVPNVKQQMLSVDYPPQKKKLR